MTNKAIVITQNVPLMREALGYEQYFKECEKCNVGVTTTRRTLRKCPRCCGLLRKTDKRPKFHG